MGRVTRPETGPLSGKRWDGYVPLTHNESYRPPYTTSVSKGHLSTDECNLFGARPLLSSEVSKSEPKVSRWYTVDDTNKKKLNRV